MLSFTTSTLLVLALKTSVSSLRLNPAQTNNAIELTHHRCGSSMNSPVCLNGGVCVNWFGLQNGYESCICESSFYGPHCEFKDVVGSNYEESQLREVEVSRSKRNTQKHEKSILSQNSSLSQENRLNKHVKRSRGSRQKRRSA